MGEEIKDVTMIELSPEEVANFLTGGALDIAQLKKKVDELAAKRAAEEAEKKTEVVSDDSKS